MSVSNPIVLMLSVRMFAALKSSGNAATVSVSVVKSVVAPSMSVSCRSFSVSSTVTRAASSR
jgi:hypothetical protein